MLSKQERQAFKQGYKAIAGIDEVGRGSLAGPVAAAVVVIKGPVKGLGLVKDSKQLSAKQREAIFEQAKKHPDIEWAVSFVEPQVIDKINIGQATVLAWQKSLKKLKKQPDFVFLDGNQLMPNLKIAQRAIVGGDKIIFAVSLASIMAKVSRDRLMVKLDKKYPQYELAVHKGYGTVLHLARIEKYKPCPIHRRSYSPVFSCLSFKEKVYDQVSKIGKGQTMSYKAVAEAIGHPNSFRAVGQALHKNTDSAVPCHRVIRSSGQVGGYNKGGKKKLQLLQKEREKS